ncbi:hypothetical protein GVAV_000764 [Gurleya vavrai]
MLLKIVFDYLLLLKLFLTIAKTSKIKKQNEQQLLVFGYNNVEEYLLKTNFFTCEIHISDFVNSIKLFLEENIREIFNIEHLFFNNHFGENINFETEFEDSHIELFMEHTKNSEKSKNFNLKTFKIECSILFPNQNYYVNDHIRIFLTCQIIQLIKLYYNKKFKYNSDQPNYYDFFFFEIFDFINESKYDGEIINIIENFIVYKNEIRISIQENKDLTNYFIIDKNYLQLFTKFMTKIFSTSHNRFLIMLEKEKLLAILDANENILDIDLILYKNLFDKILPDIKNLIENIQDYKKHRYIICQHYEKMYYTNIFRDTLEFINNNDIQRMEYTIFFDLNFQLQYFSTIHNYLLDLEHNIETNFIGALFLFIKRTIELTLKQADYHYFFNYIKGKFFKDLKNSGTINQMKFSIILGIDYFLDFNATIEIFLSQNKTKNSIYINETIKHFIIKLNLLRHKYVLYASYRLFAIVGSHFFSVIKSLHFDYFLNKNHDNIKKKNIFEDIKFTDPDYLNVIVNEIEITLYFLCKEVISYLIQSYKFDCKSMSFDEQVFKYFFSGFDIKKTIFNNIFKYPKNSKSDIDYKNFFFSFNYKHGIKEKGAKNPKNSANSRIKIGQKHGYKTTKDFIFYNFFKKNQQHNYSVNQQTPLNFNPYGFVANDQIAIYGKTQANQLNQYYLNQEYINSNFLINNYVSDSYIHTTMEHSNEHLICNDHVYDFTQDTFEIHSANVDQYNLFLSTNPINTSNEEKNLSVIVSKIYFDYNNPVKYNLKNVVFKSHYSVIGIMKFPFEFDYDLSNINYKIFVKKKIHDTLIDVPLIFIRSNKDEIKMTKEENIYNWSYAINFYIYNVDDRKYDICGFTS